MGPLVWVLVQDLSGWSIRVVGDPMAMVAGGALTRTAGQPKDPRLPGVSGSNCAAAGWRATR